MQAVRLLVCILSVLVLGSPSVAGPAERPDDKQQPVPAEEYPIFDTVVASKFLTSRTTLVVIERLTVTKLGPDEKAPPSLAFFEENRFFDGRLRQDLVGDFLIKNSRPARLERRFTFGVRVQFVHQGLVEEPDVSLAPIPVRSPAWRQRVQEPPPEAEEPPESQEPAQVVGVLAFSRVGFAARGDQALVYVEENHLNQTGAGFLVLLSRKGPGWEIVETEVLWVARAEER
jgi:hypothetical protein